MRWIMLFLLFNTAIASEKEAIAYSQKALMSYPEIKRAVKTTEQYILGQMPIDRKYLVPLGSILVTAQSGKVTTKPFKLGTRVFEGTFEPDAIYNFNTKELITVVNLGWSY